MKRGLLVAFVCIFVSAAVQADDSKSACEKITGLVRVSNTNEATDVRVHKIVYWLAKTKQENGDPATALTAALTKSCTNDAVTKFTQESLLRSLHIAEHYECIDDQNLERMKKGEAPIIRRKYREGTLLAAQPIVPITNCVELAIVISNFELAPLTSDDTSGTKRMKKGRRQTFVQKFHELGLMSTDCYRRLMETEPQDK